MQQFAGRVCLFLACRLDTCPDLCCAIFLERNAVLRKARCPRLQAQAWRLRVTAVVSLRRSLVTNSRTHARTFPRLGGDVPVQSTVHAGRNLRERSGLDHARLHRGRRQRRLRRHRRRGGDKGLRSPLGVRNFFHLRFLGRPAATHAFLDPIRSGRGSKGQARKRHVKRRRAGIDGRAGARRGPSAARWRARTAFSGGEGSCATKNRRWRGRFRLLRGGRWQAQRRGDNVRSVGDGGFRAISVCS